MKEIFGGLLGAYDDLVSRRRQFITAFPSSGVFRDEWHILYTLIKDYPSMSFKLDFIKKYLSAQRAKISNSRFVTISKFTLSAREDAFESFAKVVEDVFVECSEFDVSLDSLSEAIEAFKLEYVSTEAIAVLESGARIATEGATVNGRKYVGYEGMRSYISSEMRKLDNVMASSDRQGIVIYGVNDTEFGDEAKKKKITDFPFPSLNRIYGGIFEGDMVAISAPPKAGKSRITTHLLHSALVSGTSVAMWSIENGMKGWEALIRARHFNYLYNRDVTDVTKRSIITDNMILTGDMPASIRDMELASWSDLKTNANYGKLVSIDEDFGFDSVFGVLEDLLTQTDVKMISIDYIGLMSSVAGKAQHEVIAETYKRMLQFLEKRKIAGVFPHQFTTETVKDITRMSSDNYGKLDLRGTSAGSSEAIKTPNIILGLVASIEDLKLGNLSLLPQPSRRGGAGDPIPLYADLGTCTFGEVVR